MMNVGTTHRSYALPALAALLWVATESALVAAETDAPKGPAVTVLKAAKSCFPNIVEVSGIVMPRDETPVRPERFGLKVAEILAEPGDTVTAGQVLARLALPEGSTQNIQAPVAGLVSSSSAVIGAFASAKGEALFNIIARNDYDLIGLVPSFDIAKLAVNNSATVRIAGIGEVAGRVRRIAPTVEPNVQLGQVYIAMTTNRRLFVNASGRALIKSGESCNIAVPLTAVQYGPAGTVVQVVKRSRIETKRVEVGLTDQKGQIEIRDGLTEGEDVVARAGALLREGDVVRPVMATAATK